MLTALHIFIFSERYKFVAFLILILNLGGKSGGIGDELNLNPGPLSAIDCATLFLLSLVMLRASSISASESIGLPIASTSSSDSERW